MRNHWFALQANFFRNQACTNIIMLLALPDFHHNLSNPIYQYPSSIYQIAVPWWCSEEGLLDNVHSSCGHNPPYLLLLGLSLAQSWHSGHDHLRHLRRFPGAGQTIPLLIKRGCLNCPLCTLLCCLDSNQVRQILQNWICIGQKVSRQTIPGLEGFLF